MRIQGSKVLALGGYGMVGTAVCRELLSRRPAEIVIHSLRSEEAEETCRALAPEAGETRLTAASGDIFGRAGELTPRQRVWAQLKQLTDEDLETFHLYQLLLDIRPEFVVDCVNTATAIAYRDIFTASETAWEELEAGAVTAEAVEGMLQALYIPRLIRHIQVLYRGMIESDTIAYIKVGTSGTGGMGLNIPYTHSEEKPSRMLLAKSAMAGAHTMLLFLMARTPGAPITKEIKPAAAIAWKSIGRGPISRKGEPIRLVEARPRPLGERLSTLEPQAATVTDETLETVYIDTGENGIFSLEEFAMLTTAEQMEFVTPEEIAQALVFELEGGNTGHDVVNALDNAVLGPTYRAGLMRHWALERMNELEAEGPIRSVAFEMLGPARNSKLLFEAHLLREAFGTMAAARCAGAEELCHTLNRLVVERPRTANEVVSVGIPILLESGELIRGPRVIVPPRSEAVEITSARLERWVEGGWVDLRLANCRRWSERFQRIFEEIQARSDGDTSSRHLRHDRFWHDDGQIQPGKVVGWILSVEEQGARLKR